MFPAALPWGHCCLLQGVLSSSWSKHQAFLFLLCCHPHCIGCGGHHFLVPALLGLGWNREGGHWRQLPHKQWIVSGKASVLNSHIRLFLILTLPCTVWVLKKLSWKGLNGKDNSCFQLWCCRDWCCSFYNPTVALPFCPLILKVQFALLFPMPFREKERKEVLLLWCRVIAAIWHSHLSAWSFHYRPPILLVLSCLLILFLPLRLAVVKTPLLTCSVYLDLSAWFTSHSLIFSYPAAKWALFAPLPQASSALLLQIPL